MFSASLVFAATASRRGRYQYAIAAMASRWYRTQVVAILGALHVNGVARLLKDPSGYGEGKAGTWWTEDMLEAKPE